MSAKPHVDNHPATRVCLFSLDAPVDVHVVAQYNPAQLQLDESASWSPSATSRDDQPPLEFAATRPRTLSVELFFDGYEQQQDVKKRYLEPISRLLRVIKPGSHDERDLRPPMVELHWGTGMPPFRGVIESISTKMTMFLADGTPVRATCAIKMLEATRDSFGRAGARR